MKVKNSPPLLFFFLALTSLLLAGKEPSAGHTCVRLTFNKYNLQLMGYPGELKHRVFRADQEIMLNERKKPPSSN